MGYRRSPKVYRLQFADEEFAGLEVMVRSMPVGEFLALARLQSTLDQDNPDPGEIEQLFKTFQSKLIGWNLEDERGEKMPATVQSLYAQDLEFVLAMIGAWVEAMGGVSSDLGKDSTSGETFPEVDVPTVPLSASLPS